MRHVGSHDPTLDWQRCLICNQALSAAFAKLADMHLGPNDTERLMRTLHEEAERAVALGAAS